jgi:hypothetical protein
VIQITLEMPVLRALQQKSRPERGRQLPKGGPARLRRYWFVSGGEGENQEAGAEQYETGCGQGKEAVGNKVMMAHVTSSFSDARPN